MFSITYFSCDLDELDEPKSTTLLVRKTRHSTHVDNFVKY